MVPVRPLYGTSVRPPFLGIFRGAIKSHITSPETTWLMRTSCVLYKWTNPVNAQNLVSHPTRFPATSHVTYRSHFAGLPSPGGPGQAGVSIRALPFSHGSSPRAAGTGGGGGRGQLPPPPQSARWGRGGAAPSVAPPPPPTLCRPTGFPLYTLRRPV